MKNSYTELRDRFEAETNAFPMHFAFGQEQIDRKIKELNLDPENYHEQIVAIGWGGFVLKEDAPAFRELIDRHNREWKEAIASDETGDGFIYDMFLYELWNHEYGYTLTYEDTLDALGYTQEDIEADPRLEHGLKKAAKALRQRGGYSW
ncbi:MAG: hypothetical protein E7449_01105 [Ruminococcaceae bacterium]|nr:hypothetical protein [Oscillospiraceae bacterium]